MKADSAVRNTLRQYIVENFLYMQPGLEFGDDDSLLRAGIIDSLGVMELVTFVEETWIVDVDVYGITEANFGSISAIARFLAQRGVGRTLNAA